MQEATDALLTRQFAALGAALGDDVPTVRVAAVAGICTILDAFWELIPPATTATLVKRLASKSGAGMQLSVSVAHSFMNRGQPTANSPTKQLGCLAAALWSYISK